ncbi:MAG: type II toxin-antitoxin system VapC family toxin [Candidatus Dormiibacterota bacterium]
MDVTQLACAHSVRGAPGIRRYQRRSSRLEPATELTPSELAILRQDLEVLACAHIGYVELRAAIASAERVGRLPGTSFTKARRLLERVWAATSPILVDMAVAKRAGDLAESHGLRGDDAVHLAALQRLGSPRRVDGVACWDGDLRRAASALGYALIPA